jgi:hypothetical protein
MLTRSIVRIVGFCTRRAWAVIVFAVALAIGSGIYSARYFTINANIDDLMSSRLDWRQRDRLSHRISQSPSSSWWWSTGRPNFRRRDPRAGRKPRQASDLSARCRAGGGPFFRRNGLLYAPTDSPRT